MKQELILFSALQTVKMGASCAHSSGAGLQPARCHRFTAGYKPTALKIFEKRKGCRERPLWRSEDEHVWKPPPLFAERHRGRSLQLCGIPQFPTP